MPKFSIIIPVYNVEKYLKRTLDSIKKQTFSNYEVIIVNDGCTDDSMAIAKKYPYKIVNTKHNGVSAARNIGVKKAKGEYLVFIDSDDFIEKDLLKKLAENLENNPDLVRFQVQTIDDNKNIKKYMEQPFFNKTGEEAFTLISQYHFVENSWCYIYKRNYYLEEKFAFKENTVHEDYGLIPLVIIKAKSVNSISYIGYNYYRRSGSIMNNSDYEWTKKKVNDFYNHYLNLIKEINKTSLDSTIFKSFVANSVIQKICELNKEDYKIYKRKLKVDKVYANLLNDTTPRKIKKIIIRFSPKIYYQIMR